MYRQVMQEWLKRLRIADMTLDEGIRAMVLKMRLPGEAQQIDRMIEKFAEEYFKQNAGRFSHVDTVYVLSFSIIMLNTDLHNPFVTRKMSAADFVSNNRGIDQGRDMPAEVLQGVYRRIKADPIRMDEDDMFESEVSTFVAPLRSGWLGKLGSRNKLGAYKKYWFVLTDGCLYYFVSRHDRAPRCIIPLELCTVEAGGRRKECALWDAVGDAAPENG